MADGLHRCQHERARHSVFLSEHAWRHTISTTQGRKVVLEIAGKRYVIRSTADEVYVRELAAYVDRQIRDVEASSKPSATHSLAVLAALNIADELHRERRKVRQLRERIRSKSRSLLAYLDREVTRLRGPAN